eukprot:Skav212423  [mRNA]  locus=scaffold202:148776:151259:+ [translate_table: standard]
MLRGPNSRATKRDLFSVPEPSLTVQTQALGTLNVRLVHRYKHLGFQIHASGSLAYELRVRVGAAHTAFNQHARNVYSNQHLGLKRRLQIFQSCVLSVLFWNSGTWHALRDAEFRRLSGAYRRLVRRLLVKEFPLEQLCHWSDQRLFAYIGVLPLRDELRLQRLRYYARLVREGPDALWALLVGEASWLGQIPDDFTWLYTNVQSKTFRPAPDSPTGQKYWDELIRTQFGTWQGLLKKARQHALIQLCKDAEVAVFHEHFLQVLQDHFPELQPVSITSDEKPGFYVCLPCQQVFQTKTGWATHTFRKHGRRATARYLADTTTCDHCFHSFLNEHRLYLHLRYSTACHDALRARGVAVEPLPGRGSRTWQLQQQYTQCPYLHAEGPCQQLPADAPLPALSPHENDLLEDLTHLERVEWELEAIDTIQETLWTRIRTVLSSHPVSLEEMGTVLDTWHAFILEDMKPFHRLRPLRPALLLRAIDLAKTRLSYAWLAPDLAMTTSHLLPADHAASQLGRLPLEAIAAVEQPAYGPRTRQAIFVHLYSGRRRQGDFQQALEGLCWGDDAWPPIVISLDIVIHPQKGNIMDVHIRKQWLDAVKRGFITGALMGPPCETWSVARERWHIDHQGPRPLRSSSEPWGFKALLIKEARQLYAANALLFFAIAVHLLQWAQGRAAITEHPEPPDPERFPTAPSIWRLAVMAILDHLPANHSYSIYQGYFGAASPKPTTLMGAHVEDFRVTSVKHHVRKTLPPPLKMGRNGQGNAYATFQLKEYPAALNSALAEAFWNHWHRAPLPPAPLYPPDDVLQLFMDLCTHDMTGQEMGHDFAFN